MKETFWLRCWCIRWYLRCYRAWLGLNPISHMAQRYTITMNALWDGMSDLDRRFCLSRETA